MATERVEIGGAEYTFSPNTNAPKRGAWWFCNLCSGLVYDLPVHARWHAKVEKNSTIANRPAEAEPPGVELSAEDAERFRRYLDQLNDRLGLGSEGGKLRALLDRKGDSE
jgi:hypothetical protein